MLWSDWLISEKSFASDVNEETWSVLTAGESKQDEDVEEEEFHNIHHHATKGDLKRTQIGIDREDVD